MFFFKKWCSPWQNFDLKSPVRIFWVVKWVDSNRVWTICYSPWRFGSSTSVCRFVSSGNPEYNIPDLDAEPRSKRMFPDRLRISRLGPKIERRRFGTWDQYCKPFSPLLILCPNYVAKLWCVIYGTCSLCPKISSEWTWWSLLNALDYPIKAVILKGSFKLDTSVCRFCSGPVSMQR